MSADCPPKILKNFGSSAWVYIVWPHVTKSKKKESQNPIVKVGWIGIDLKTMSLLLAPPHPNTKIAWLSFRCETQQTKCAPRPVYGATVVRMCL